MIILDTNVISELMHVWIPEVRIMLTAYTEHQILEKAPIPEK